MDGVPNGTWDGREAYSPPRTRCRRFAKSIRHHELWPHRRGHGQSGAKRAAATRFTAQPLWKNQPGNLTANDFFRNPVLPVQLTHFTSTAPPPAVRLPSQGPDGRNNRSVLRVRRRADSQRAITFLTVPTAAEKGPGIFRLSSLPRTRDRRSSYSLYRGPERHDHHAVRVMVVPFWTAE